MRPRRFALALSLGAAVVALAGGCTQDFDAFEFDSQTDAAGAGGSAGATSTDGGGGTAGASPTDAGRDAPPDAPPDAPSDAPSDAPAPDSGDADACGEGLKRCGDLCVGLDLTAYGCGGASCTPCAPRPHAALACAGDGQCGLGGCDSGYADCDGAPSNGCEVDTRSSLTSCGSCGHTCTLPNATPRCSAGRCEVGQCSAGFADCDGDPSTGCEANLRSPTSCGACGRDCTALSAGHVCQDGQCQPTGCPAGTAECDGDASTSCETDVLQDAQHCGFCNNRCQLPHASARCEAGRCAIDTCDSGWADCDGVASNGCEVELATTADHCGACGRSCASAGTVSRVCAGGVCASTCQSGRGNCSQPAAPATDDGCETNLLTSAGSCGACGRACSAEGVASLACAGGRCTSTCATGRGNCSQPAAPTADDGCEQDLTADPSHCGACHRGCSSFRAGSLSCVAGLCAPTCLSGYASCNQPAAPAADDGCEQDVRFDVANCGACGRACSAANTTSISCSNGRCDSLCASGFGNCGQPLAPAADDGCEASLATSTDHCGSCGRACSSDGVAERRCAGGVCTSSCSSLRGNCSTPAAPDADDGCETNLGTSADHCGACGRACSTTGVATRACTGGTCSSSCQSGLGNCSEPTAPAADDGCETNITSDALDCGACGRACSTTGAQSLECRSSACTPSCAAGRVSCSNPAAPSADNGCEGTASATNCGGCGNSCSAQGGKACANDLCVCTANDQCRSGGQSNNTGRCGSGGNAGRCECNDGWGNFKACHYGEECFKIGIVAHECRCNGGAACGGAASVVCCEEPAGCKDLATDRDSCGACGRACAPGFVCQAAVCRCDAAADCNAGSAGTCSSTGNCVCGGVACAVGQRCLSDGRCG